MLNVPYRLIMMSVGIILLAISAFFYARHKEQIGYDRATIEYKAMLLASEKEARLAEQNMYTKLESARNEASIKTLEIDKLNRDLSAASRSLRDTITASKNRVSTDSTEALRIKADTALTVFGECQARYGEMAETADRHAIDVEMLLKSWPNY